MGKVSLKDIVFSSLKTINIDGGNVRHILKSNDKEFKGFGEAYFSDINPGSIKAWKCHNKMHMNLVVPFGRVKFVFHEENTSRFLEKEVDENDPLFKANAKIAIDQARVNVLGIHPGKVVSEEREVGMDGTFTYEFDIQTNAGYEIKIDVDAITGKIEEANFELYEIGMEPE